MNPRPGLQKPLWSRVRVWLDLLGVRAELKLEHLCLQPPNYTSLEWPELLSGLSRALGLELEALLDEPELARLEAHVAEGVAAIPDDAPLPRVHVADLSLARLCYVVCRATRPQVVVETGVAYGATSAFILQALERNGQGQLDSIDRPPPVPGARECVGSLVPDRLRARWRLHRGSSARVLPGLLRSLAPVDVFLHDSRHTYRNILFELRAATRRLAPGAVVLADDIERSRAFETWARGARPGFQGVLREAHKASLLGVATSVASPAARPHTS